MSKIKGINTRRHILEAAARCIVTLGIDKTTTRAIAKEAKVSHGLVPHYCPKKSELFSDVMDYIISELRTAIRVRTEKLTPENKILENMRANFEIFLKKPHYYCCFVLAYYFAGVRKDFKHIHTVNYSNSVKQLELYLLDGLHQYKITRTQEEVTLVAEALMDELEGGLIYFFFSNHGMTGEKYINRHLAKQHMLIRHFFDQPFSRQSS